MIECSLGHQYNRKVRIAATIELCGPEIEPVQLENMIMDSLTFNLSNIDVVVFVTGGGRFNLGHKNSFKRFLDWLDVKAKPGNFVFLHTNNSLTSDEQKLKNLHFVLDQLGIKSLHDNRLLRAFAFSTPSRHSDFEIDHSLVDCLLEEILDKSLDARIEVSKLSKNNLPKTNTKHSPHFMRSHDYNPERETRKRPLKRDNEDEEMADLTQYVNDMSLSKRNKKF